MSGTLDARGLRCPWPVLRLARAMARAREQAVLVDDPRAIDEITTLAGTRDWDVAPIAGGLRVTKRVS